MRIALSAETQSSWPVPGSCTIAPVWRDATPLVALTLVSPFDGAEPLTARLTPAEARACGAELLRLAAALEANPPPAPPPAPPDPATSAL